MGPSLIGPSADPGLQLAALGVLYPVATIARSNTGLSAVHVCIRHMALIQQASSVSCAVQLSLQMNISLHKQAIKR